MPKAALLLILVFVLVLLAGCGTVATVAPVCGAMRTVYISKADVLTEQTASTIEGNNLAYATLCGHSTPKPQPSSTGAAKTS